MARAFIGIGGNIDPEAHIRGGLLALARRARVMAVSTFSRTPALGRPDDPAFINGVALVKTELPPLALQALLKEIEAGEGRVRTEDPYAPRTLDLDLLLYDNLVLQAPELTLPSPDLSTRPFLAMAVCELEPDLLLPDGWPVNDLCGRFINVVMEPLPGFTQQVREELIHEYEAGTGADS